MINQKDLEQVIQYQVKSLDMMKELLFKQIEEDKRQADHDTELMNEELEFDHNGELQND